MKAQQQKRVCRCGKRFTQERRNQVHCTAKCRNYFASVDRQERVRVALAAMKGQAR